MSLQSIIENAGSFLRKNSNFIFKKHKSEHKHGRNFAGNKVNILVTLHVCVCKTNHVLLLSTSDKKTVLFQEKNLHMVIIRTIGCLAGSPEELRE